MSNLSTTSRPIVRVKRHLFSIINRSTRRLSTTTQQPPTPTTDDDTATILQGPSLLTNTGSHRPNPSLFFLPGLRSLPFWTAPSSSQSDHRVAFNDPTVSSVLQHVESHYDVIKEEYLSSVVGTSSTSSEEPQKGMESDYDAGHSAGSEHQKLHAGGWEWHSFLLNGEKRPGFVERCPETAACLEALGDDLFGTPFSFAFFSSLQGGASIKSHSGPMNLRLRFHLPLIVPSSSGVKCGINVGGQIREWEEGKALVLDDSFVHEVWNRTGEPRVLLLFDIWHPDIRKDERRRIEKMFEYAKGQGWIGGNDGGGRET